MRIIRFPDANKTDIIAPSDTIEETVDKWRCNGNPKIEVTIYAYLPPIFSDSRSDGSRSFAEAHPIPFSEREGEPSDFSKEDDE